MAFAVMLPQIDSSMTIYSDRNWAYHNIQKTYNFKREREVELRSCWLWSPPFNCWYTHYTQQHGLRKEWSWPGITSVAHIPLGKSPPQYMASTTIQNRRNVKNLKNCCGIWSMTVFINWYRIPHQLDESSHGFYSCASALFSPYRKHTNSRGRQMSQRKNCGICSWYCSNVANKDIIHTSTSLERSDGLHYTLCKSQWGITLNEN